MRLRAVFVPRVTRRDPTEAGALLSPLRPYKPATPEDAVRRPGSINEQKHIFAQRFVLLYYLSFYPLAIQRQITVRPARKLRIAHRDPTNMKSPVCASLSTRCMRH